MPSGSPQIEEDPFKCTPTTKIGAHLLLQVRTRVLNGALRKTFHAWYPGFAENSELQPRAA
jgi:hypothetical protein